MAAKSQPITFVGGNGESLAARLDLPSGLVRGTALFAHCFTCSKDLGAVRAISRRLARHGVAVLRFDFTGLGSSEGEFANTNFSSNVADLSAAAAYLNDNYSGPDILIGHSLGGAAMLAAAAGIPQAKGVATIGAPADTAHVLHHFGADLDRIKNHGEAEVTLGGRQFSIQRQFVDDVAAQNILAELGRMKKSLLILHAPLDETVGIENASALFQAARHPKSFISLDGADHLLTRAADGHFAADMIAAWAGRLVGNEAPQDAYAGNDIRITETGEGTFQNLAEVGRHTLFADEPATVGGGDTGPTPYDFLSIALGACTSMTLRLYARHKKISLDRVRVFVDHEKVHARDCDDCGRLAEAPNAKIDRFERRIEISGDLTPDQRQRLIEIADRCPVHRTLESGAAIVTTEAADQ